jgi:penicillin-binding protein 1C
MDEMDSMDGVDSLPAVHRVTRFLRTGFLCFFIVLALGAVVWCCLPKPKLLDDVSFSTVVRDRDGNLMRLTIARDQRFRIKTSLDEIPGDLVTAVTRLEDRNYPHHPGFDIFALGRALWGRLTGVSRSGASTLSMQVARLRFHLQTRTIVGKLTQIYYALLLERHYSKSEILTAYFNLAPYGRNIEGVSAASWIYFNKAPAQLNRQEILALAVLPQSPSRRAPRSETEPAALATARQKLNQRLWNDPLADLPLRYRTISELPFLAPQFVQSVVSRHSDPTIALTISANLQRDLNQQLVEFLHERASTGLDNAACLLIDARTMEVLVSIGSADFWNKKIQGQNDGTRQLRSPGSSLKPFVYALALDRGLINPSTLVYDTPNRFDDYLPENMDGKFEGPISARLALVRSRNLPAVTLTARLGPSALFQLLQRANVRGLDATDSYGVSAVLGTVNLSMEDLVRLYSALVNGGQVKSLRKTLGDWSDPGVKLFSPEAAFLTLDMLSTPEAGIHVNAAPTVNLPYKTGTSTGFHDAWCIGVIDHYVLAVWVGRFNGQSSPAFISRTAAVPLFLRLANRFVTDFRITVSALKPPANANLRQVPVCTLTGSLPGPNCPNKRLEWVIPGVSPITTCKVHLEKDRESWDSEAEAFFNSIGLQRKETSNNPAADQLKILPLPRVITWTSDRQNRTVALRARTETGVKKVYWFANREYLGVSLAGQPLYWNPAPGVYSLAATDDQGSTDTARLEVEGDRR